MGSGTNLALPNFGQISNSRFVRRGKTQMANNIIFDKTAEGTHGEIRITVIRVDQEPWPATYVRLKEIPYGISGGQYRDANLVERVETEDEAAEEGLKEFQMLCHDFGAPGGVANPWAIE